MSSVTTYDVSLLIFVGDEEKGCLLTVKITTATAEMDVALNIDTFFSSSSF